MFNGRSKFEIETIRQDVSDLIVKELSSFQSGNFTKKNVEVLADQIIERIFYFYYSAIREHINKSNVFSNQISLQDIKTQHEKMNNDLEDLKKSVHQIKTATVSTLTIGQRSMKGSSIDSDVQHQNLITMYQNLKLFIKRVADSIITKHVEKNKSLENDFELLSAKFQSGISNSLFKAKIKAMDKLKEEFSDIEIYTDDYSLLMELENQSFEFVEKITRSIPQAELIFESVGIEFDSDIHELSSLDCNKNGLISLSVYPSYKINGESKEKAVVFTGLRFS